MIYKILPLLLLLALPACSSDDNQDPEGYASQSAQSQPHHPAFQSVTPAVAMELIENKDDLVIIDVRTSKEIRQYGAVAGSQHIGMGHIAKNGVPFPEDQPLLVICAVGGRSYAVGRFLEKKGYTEIYNLSGGLNRWSKEGLPVVYPN